MDKIKLLDLDSNYIDGIARIHQLAFPHSAWSRLGRSVVERYYLWHLLGPHPIVRAMGAFADGELAGYCVSGVFKGSTSGFLSKNRFHLLLKVLTKPWLILNAEFIGKMRSGAKILKRASTRELETAPKKSREPSYGILAIAVSPSHQSLGIGKLLMDDAEKAAVDMHYHQMDLTVNPSNVDAVRFYERLGWQRFAENDTWTGMMIKPI